MFIIKTLDINKNYIVLDVTICTIECNSKRDCRLVIMHIQISNITRFEGLQNETRLKQASFLVLCLKLYNIVQ